MGEFQVHSYFYNIKLIIQYAEAQIFVINCVEEVYIYIYIYPQCGLHTSLVRLVKVVSKNTVQLLDMKRTMKMSGVWKFS